MADDEKKIISDEDWKQQAQKDKEKLKEKSGEQQQLPPANFMTLVSSLSVQAMFYMGMLHDPNSKEPPQVNFDLAKHNIDMLGVLEEKTKGNLTDEENRMLSTTIHQLRMQYVQAAQ